jgi:hypothetical protein
LLLLLLVPTIQDNIHHQIPQFSKWSCVTKAKMETQIQPLQQQVEATSLSAELFIAGAVIIRATARARCGATRSTPIATRFCHGLRTEINLQLQLVAAEA